MPGPVGDYIRERERREAELALSRDERIQSEEPSLKYLRERQEPVVTETDRILDYAAQSPVKKDELDRMLETQRQDLLDKGVGALESWGQAAQTIREQIDSWPQSIASTEDYARYMIHDTREAIASQAQERRSRTERSRDDDFEIGGR